MEETQITDTKHDIVNKIKMMGGIAGISKELKVNGIYRHDPRLKNVFEYDKRPSDSSDGYTSNSPDDSDDDIDHIFETVRDIWHLLEPVLNGCLSVPDWKEFKTKLTTIYDNIETECNSGDVAKYIPQLARVDCNAWGMAVCTISGQTFQRGRATQHVCVQSCCKPINYLIAMDMLGSDTVHQHVGREPSGQKFNALMLNDELKPHNPLINSGAIMVCGLLAHAMENMDSGERFEKIIQSWNAASGNIQNVGFSNSVYLSERKTADRNYALAYFMRETNDHKPIGFPDNVDIIDVVEFYFQCCSIELSCQALSVVAATLANSGICPLTGKRVWMERHVRNCLSLMQSCGMYDYSGQFGFEIGLPAKSGVSGLVMTVIPGKVGFCTWSPRLDTYGNSVRGVEFCRHIAEEFHYHSLDSYSIRYSRSISDTRLHTEKVASACTLAAIADLNGLKQLLFEGFDMNSCDYDKRTPLHLAACEGHLNVVQFLVENCECSPRPTDRWGNTPLDDAIREGHEHVQQFLQVCLEKKNERDI